MLDTAIDPEYGPAIGLAVPQANTTVEPEMQALLGANHTLLTARMTSGASDSRQRLLDYLDRLPQTLAQFDLAPLRVAGFACTGSSYLVGAPREAERLAALSAQRVHAVLSAAQSILQASRLIGAKRIALLSPYPDWLSQAGQAYWKAAGLTLTAVAGLPDDFLDTRAIYKLRTAAVLGVFKTLDYACCDTVLMSGTGMPTLGALQALAARRLPVPVLSSNLCLAWAMRCVTAPDESAASLLEGMLGSQAAPAASGAGS